MTEATQFRLVSASIVGFIFLTFLFVATYLQAEGNLKIENKIWESNKISQETYRAPHLVSETDLVPDIVKTSEIATLRKYGFSDKLSWGLDFISNPKKAKSREIFYAYDLATISGHPTEWVNATESPEWEKLRETNPLFFGWAIAKSKPVEGQSNELMALPVKWNKQSATVLRDATKSNKVERLRAYFGDKLFQKIGEGGSSGTFATKRTYFVTNIPWKSLSSIKPQKFVGDSGSWENIRDDLPYHTVEVGSENKVK